MGTDELGRDMRFSGDWVAGMEGIYVKAARITVYAELSNGQNCTVTSDVVKIDDAEVRRRILASGVISIGPKALLAMTLDMALHALMPKVEHMRSQILDAVGKNEDTKTQLKAVIAKAKSRETSSPGVQKMIFWLEDYLRRIST